MAKNITIAALAVAVLALAGLYAHNKSKVEYIGANQPAASSTAETNAQTAPKTAAAPAPSADTSKCESDLTAALKQDDASYEKGSVLLSFHSNVDFAAAKGLVEIKGYSVQDEADSAQNYPGTHRLMAAVPEGKELAAVCEFRAEASVKYAGVSELFNLHQ